MKHPVYNFPTVIKRNQVQTETTNFGFSNNVNLLYHTTYSCVAYKKCLLVSLLIFNLEIWQT